VRSDFGIKISPNFPHAAQRSSQKSFRLKGDAFKIAQNANKYVGYLCNKICRQELSKIAQ